MLVWVFVAACRFSAPPAPPPETVRRHAVELRLDDASVRLEAPVAELTHASGRQLLIVGAVHVGTPAYYASIEQILAPVGVVVAEGVTPDAPDVEAEQSRTDSFTDRLAPYGLTVQSRALSRDARWVSGDMSVRDLKAALREAGASEAWIYALLDDRDRSSLSELFAGTDGDARLVRLAQLALMRSLAEPSPTEGPDADLYWDVVIGRRNEVAVEKVSGHLAPRMAVIYGADHLGDLVARLARHGFTLKDESRLTVLDMPYAELGLGRVQVEQLLQR